MIPSDQQPAEDETTFDIYEIDEQIIKNDEYVQKKSPELKEVKNRFKFVSGLTKEEIKKKDPNSDYLKYFAQISTKNFQYIGNLSSQLKREKYGYSLMDNKDEFSTQLSRKDIIDSSFPEYPITTYCLSTS